MSKRQPWMASGSRLAHGVTETTEWSLRLATLVLRIHRAPDADPRQWFGTCDKVGVAMYPIGQSGTPVEEAQNRMILYVEGCLAKMTKDIATVMPELGKVRRG